MRTITKEDYQNWLADPVTHAFKEVLDAWREQLRNRLEEGVHLSGQTPDSDITAARIVGNLDVIRQIKDLDYEGMINFLERD